MLPRGEIKANARRALSANYWPMVGYLFLGGIIAACIMVIGFIGLYADEVVQIMTTGNFWPDGVYVTMYVISVIGIFFYVLVGAGIQYFSYKVYRGDRPQLGDVFSSFKNGNFGRVFGGILLMSIKIFLWSLLLYIPGIVKTYEYMMVPYLLIDRPDLSIKECFKMSRVMTDGYKGDLFVMVLSFIGWMILAEFTGGLLHIFYTGPYIKLSFAGAYDYLKRVRMSYGDQLLRGQQGYNNNGGQYQQPQQGYYNNGGQYQQPQQNTSPGNDMFVDE